MINPIIAVDGKIISCPHCGYAHPHVTAVAQGGPNHFTFRINCPLCGYSGDLEKKDVEEE